MSQTFKWGKKTSEKPDTHKSQWWDGKSFSSFRLISAVLTKLLTWDFHSDNSTEFFLPPPPFRWLLRSIYLFMVFSCKILVRCLCSWHLRKNIFEAQKKLDNEEKGKFVIVKVKFHCEKEIVCEWESDKKRTIRAKMKETENVVMSDRYSFIGTCPEKK